MGIKLIVIARFRFEYEAHLAKGWLDSSGIESFIQNLHPLSNNFLPNINHDMIELVVEQSKAVEAVGCLRENGIECEEL